MVFNSVRKFQIICCMNRTITVLLILLAIYSTPGYGISTPDNQPSSINRPPFYNAMENDSKPALDSELVILQAVKSEPVEAFEGALLMKKAGMGGSPASKLHLFKEGKKMLEKAIQQEPGNAEYRFLRLIVQENAPGFLGYKNDIEKDSAFIRKSYPSLPEAVQQAISRYNKKSKVLKLDLS